MGPWKSSGAEPPMSSSASHAHPPPPGERQHRARAMGFVKSIEAVNKLWDVLAPRYRCVLLVGCVCVRDVPERAPRGASDGPTPLPPPPLFSSDRAGGYTRVLRCGFRKGDRAPMAIIEYVGREGELRPARPGTAREATPEVAPVAVASAMSVRAAREGRERILVSGARGSADAAPRPPPRRQQEELR